MVTDNQYSQLLVEVICYGRYGRILVLVCLGIGCTAWYGVVPGAADPPSVICSQLLNRMIHFKI